MIARAVTALAVAALVVCAEGAFAAPAPAPVPSCNASAPLESARLEAVVDGDTLALVDGRHVRLIGVNTPEVARRGRPAEAGAGQALGFVRTFLKQGTLGLQEGSDSRDRYDRTLAHVFAADGRSLEQELVRAGLARVAIVPPNLGLAECLLRTEDRARSARTGLWGSGEFAPRLVVDLVAREGGFRLLRGRLGGLEKSRSSWWIELDERVALQVSRSDWRYFDESALRSLAGREVEVRGWLTWRDSPQTRDKARAPWVMRLGHPLAIRPAPALR